MNISDYNNKTKFLMPLGTAVLKGGLLIASTDQFFYKYLGKRPERVFTDLIHPDYKQEFLDAVARLDSGTQLVLAPLITSEGVYRYMLFRLDYSDDVIDNSRCIDMYISDVVAAMDKHIINRVNLMKYRRILGLNDCLYFDYVRKTNKICIYMYANDKSYMFLAEDLDEWSQQMWENYLWSDVEKRKFELFYAYLKDGLDDFKLQFSTTFFSKGGRNDSIVATGSTLFDEQGGRIIVGTIKLNASIEEKPYYTTEASKDSATGLMNKRAIMEYAAMRFNEAGNSRLALYVIDIDDFKNINDRYGHLFGDEVIYKVAETIKRIVGATGTVARFGGDEFVVLLENCDDHTVDYTLKTLYWEISRLYKGGNVDLNVTISAGVANYPEDGKFYEVLFEKADKALYIAKANGKNNYVIYDEEKHKDVEVVNDAKRMQGLKSIASRVKRSMLFSEIMLELSGKGTLAMGQLMSKVCDLYDVDGMSVFVGEELKCQYRYGKYRKKIDKYTLMTNQEFVSLITEDDMVALEDIKQCDDKTFYMKYNPVEINSCLTSIYREGGVVKAVVTFDIFNTARAWSDSDMINMNAIGKLIGRKVTE